MTTTTQTHTVIIYTTPTCVYCKMAKDFFQKNNVQFQEKDVLTDLAARDAMIQKSGQMGVPVIEVDDKIIIGFNQRQLQEVLGL